MAIFSALWFFMVGLMLASTATLCIFSRLSEGRYSTYVSKLLAIVLLGNILGWLATVVTVPFSWSTSLPIPLCDVATILTVAALWTCSKKLVELVYFWGIAGTLQGVLTPDLALTAPFYVKAEYLIAHVVVVIAAIYLVVGMRIYPTRLAAIRVFVITITYTAFVGVIDFLTGGNYMYLAHIPTQTTLLNFLGPWPWYILSAAGLAIVLLAILNAPFVWQRRTGKAV
ncbi:MAG: TIGR02206 family membrane protein [Actinobacteria bacterium]|nr:TIGR02206 family membrane protein [Actinomycetota bacterium]MCL6104648.1 TIGR02206 family membrane protein [Actinomycetota bacterium]